MATMFEIRQAQNSLIFPQSLTQKYRPNRVANFIGLEKQKRVLSKLISAPRACGLLFLGAPGTGKTSLAFAFAAEIGAEVHHIGSQECRVENLQSIAYTCNFVPLSGGFHVVIVDEADVMSDAAQKYLLSKLDGSETCLQTIWIFTCNSTERLEERFLSRCLKLEFNSYGSGQEIADFLAQIWQAEAGDAPMPNLKKLAVGNIRESLQRLETELLAI